MVEVAGVITELVDVGGHLNGEAVVFLEVDREVRGCAGADGGQGG